VALVVSAQSPSPGQNPGTNAPVAILPDALAQPQPGIQPQPAGGHWADAFRIQKVSEDDDWTRHFRIGAVAGMNISANFSMKSPSKIPGNKAANGNYDDGYVLTDDTGNAGGWTSYWGYNNASQLSGSTLTMHSTTSYSSSGSSEASGVFPGFDMSYGGNLFYLGRARIGWDLGFGLLPISITDNSSMSASVKQSIYTFNTGTIIVPGAPYQGGPSGIGPTIKTNIISVSSGTNNTGTLNGSHTLEVMLYTVRLGPSVYWDLNENFGLSASVGPAIGIVSGDYKYDEIVSAGGVSARNHGQFGATDVVYGGYVNATLLYHVPNEKADIYIGAQFMSLGNANFSGGGREASLKLGGQVYISAGINWPF
jgi:hypothetical protein